jgi:uncharacterized protein
MVDEQTIRKVADALLAATPPGSQVILFGSYARGQADSRSDLDFLVVEPEVQDLAAEMVRLRRALRGMVLPIDVIVLSRQRFEYWKDTPNTLAHRAMKEGRVYEQVA